MAIWNPKTRKWEEDNEIWNPKTRKWGTLDNKEQKSASKQGVTFRDIKANNVEKTQENRTWFQKGAFEDGYDIGDVTKTILGTVDDASKNVRAGIIGMGEKVVDAGAYVAGAVGGIFSDKFAEDMKDFIAKDLYDEEKAADTKLARVLFGDHLGSVTEGLGLDTEKNSVLGEKTDALAQSAGQLAGQIGLQVVGVPWWVTSGATSFGSEVETAFNEGATYAESGLSGVISAGAEILTEKISGGIKFGGKTLDEGLTKLLSQKISNKVVRTLSNLGIDAVGEGAEEVISEVCSRIGSSLYKEENIGELLTSEEAFDSYLESFIGGAVLGGGSGTIQAINKAKQGRDYKTGITENEQRVVDKEIENRIAEREKTGEKVDKKTRAEIEADVKEDLQKGYISIETIESALGGETLKRYNSISEQEASMTKELEDLKNQPNTVGNFKKYNDLEYKLRDFQKKSNKTGIKEQLSKEVSDMTANDTYLRESYNEKGRRSQAFEADMNTYDEKMRATVQKAIDSGILNNTRRTHEFVDMIAKISADKGVSFDFTDNAKLKETGLALDGKSVNGYVKDGNITLNVNSAKALNKVVGHEIVHILEGSEMYAELQEAVKDYATTKGEYKSKLEAITRLYESVNGANVEQELTADLIGEYLFSDKEFVQQLSTKNRNIFQKIYDEIKYLVKTITSGSKEAKQLQKVKKIFDEVYRESPKAKDSIHYSVEKFATEFDAWDKKNPTKVFDVAVTSNALKSIGIEEKSITMDSSKLIKIMSKHEGMTEDVIKKIPNIINDPMLILESKKSSNRLVLLGEVLDGNGKTVVAVLELNPTNRKGVVLDEIKIASAYGKDNLQNFINTSKILYSNPDNAKTSSWLTSTGLQLPVESITTGSTNSISQNEQNTTENQKYSLSEDDIAPIGNWNIKGEEIALEEISAKEEVAPVQQNVEEWNPAVSDVLTEGPFTQTEKNKKKESEITKFSRKEYHNGIIDYFKEKFKENGFDFDSVLRNAKDKSTFSSVDNTPQRFMEKTLGYKEGQILSDLTVNQTAQNESRAIQWLNSYTDRKNGFLAQISKQYGIKPKSKESAAAQMYGEGFYVNKAGDLVEYGDAELAKDFPDPRVQANIKSLAKDERIRKIYDDTLNQINESRKRNGYPEIPRRKDYFLHFRAMEDTFSRLGLPFNPNDIKAKDLPTDINGVTADLKPGQPYFASAQQRKGNRTTYDLLGGLERYLGSAKNQIYHIDDIQTLRALRNYIADTYGQAKGLESLDELSEEEVAQRIEQVYDAHLSTFAKFLNEEANVLAGKTSLIDRGLEGVIGRKGITFLDTVNKKVGSNMVGMNVSSSLTNLVSVVQGFAKANKYDFVKAFTQTIANKLGTIIGQPIDNFTEQNPLIVRRKGAEKFTRTPYEVAKDSGYILASAIDDFSTEIITRAKYNELTRKARKARKEVDSYKAHIEADKWASRILGDRSYGQQPQLYNSKMLGLVTKFQLEVRNQLDSMFYDTIQESKYSNEEIQNGFERNARIAAKVGSTFLQLAVGQHIFGQVFEAIAGYNPTFDIIEVLTTMFGFDDEEDSEDTALDNIEQGFLALMEDLPYTSTFTGGRIPIASALPIEEVLTGTDQYGNEKSRLRTIGEALPYYLLPTGYGQIKKSAQGLRMFDDDLPIAGSYTNSEKLRYSVEDTPTNRIQAAVFGQYANKNAREYFDEGRTPLSGRKTQELVDLDIPISEYWDIQDKLKGKKKLAEKADVIADLELPISKKNILINNASKRKDPIDMTDYDLYEDFEEFDYSMQNPEKYLIAKVTGGYKSYKKYSEALNNIEGDKNGKGETISGSRKKKVVNYINGLNVSQEEKVVLFKNQYPSDNRYNAQIINYISRRADLSHNEKVTLLTELGFKVSQDGTVRW